MKTMARRSLGTGGLALLLATGALAGCQGAGEEPAAGRRTLPLAVERLADDLALRPEQRAGLEAVATLLDEHREGHLAEREARFAEVRAMVGSGEVDAEAVHGHVDEKADELRGLAHAVADRVIALVRGLDPEQRAAAVERLDRFHERAEAMHERMAAEGGPRGFFERLHGRRCGHGAPFDGE